MTNFEGKYLIENGEHRLLKPINSLCIITAAIGCSAEAAVGITKPFAPGEHAPLECNLMPFEVHLPLAGPVHAAVANVLPDLIELNIKALNKNHREYEHKTGGFKEPMLFAFSAALVQLYEENLQFLNDEYGERQYWKWPNFWNFVRAVRNSCSHGYKLRIDSKTAPAVTWHGVSYHSSQNGHLVIGGDFLLGDILILMVEVSEELDKLGCPVPT